jgi:hypothetical protein
MPRAAGTRVRATLRTETSIPGGVLLAGDQIVGRLLSMDDENVVLEEEGQTSSLTLPRSALCGLDASLGVQSRAEQLAKGGGIAGSVVGGAAGWLLGSMEDNSSAGPYILKGAALFGLAGGLIGAAIGSAIKEEKWEPFDRDQLALSVAPMPHHGLAASLTLRF